VNKTREKYVPYNKTLKQFSRELRNKSTLAEIKLWSELRAAKLGYTFNRQKPLQNYIVDFYCKPLHLVLEVDGMSHWDEEQQKKDKIRQGELEESGLHFLRFDDDEVHNEIENVVLVIESKIEELEKLYPAALKRKKIHS
jgi:very-short-patch-repair endonuclease